MKLIILYSLRFHSNVAAITVDSERIARPRTFFFVANTLAQKGRVKGRYHTRVVGTGRYCSVFNLK